MKWAVNLQQIKKKYLLIQKVMLVCLMLLLFTRPLMRDGGMAEDHGAPEAKQLSRARTRGRREIESPKSKRRKESVAGQCRMR